MTRLRIARQTLGWGQPQLAARLGVNRMTVRRWDDGTYEPPPHVLAWIEDLAAYVAAHSAPQGW